jgi:CRP-like cAMP-binding protein
MGEPFDTARKMKCFRNMKDADLHIVLRQGSLRVFRRHRALCYQGETASSVFLIFSGSASRLKYRSDDSCLVLGKVEEGDWVGVVETLLSCPYLNDVIPSVQMEALAFSPPAFRGAMEVPGMKEALLEKMARAQYHLHTQIEFNTPMFRLLTFVLGHAQTSRETVNRYLQALQREALLCIGRGNLKIPDLSALEDRLTE